MHEFYPIKADKIIKDKGIQSYEIMMKDRKIVIKRAYITADPEDEDMNMKVKWREVIDYRNRENLRRHFEANEAKYLADTLWSKAFIKKFEAKIKAEKAKLATKAEEENE